GYGNYGERGYREPGYGGHSMAERSMGDRGGYRSEYENRDLRARPMGRAPKGYQRSDERIKEDVCDRLMHSWVDAENVEIDVRSGEVVLAGTVEDRQSKREIEDIADRVLGVKDVQNNIRVRPRGGEEQQRPTSTSATSQKKPSA
ncbi:MAG: BON domain-containing protein, partial [Myxococcales bacterium]|nr:BON domain-containing protein [Myxococcales bacterium]